MTTLDTLGYMVSKTNQKFFVIFDILSLKLKWRQVLSCRPYVLIEGEKGITHELTVRLTLQQNGVAERKNRTLMEMTRCVLKSKKLPHKFWLEGLMCAIMF